MKRSDLKTSSKINLFLGIFLIVGAGMSMGQSFTPTGGTVVANYWNSTNTGGTAIFTGTSVGENYFYVKISVDGGALVTITGGEGFMTAGESINVALTSGNIETAGSTLSDGETYEMYAVLNSGAAPVDTIKLTSSAVTVDKTVPTGFTVGGITAVGNNVVSNKWNGTNTSIDVSVPIGNDNSLLTPGEVQLLGKIGSNPYEDLGAASVITGINTTKTMSIASATLESLLGFTDGQIIYIKAEITDKAGNLTTGDAGTSELTIDQTAPTISSVAGTPSSGTLGIGDATTSITVTFDEVVRLSSGNLEITLETGAIDQVLVIGSASIDNVNSASQTYTVQAGDESTDLTVGSLDLSGGNNLRDAAGNDANLNIPGGSNLGDNANIVVDGVLPTVNSITSTTANGNYSVGQDINITVNFSEAVTLASGNLQIQLETGTVDRTVSISSITNSTSASGTYTVQTDDESSDLSVNGPLTLSSGTIQDAAGNDVDLAVITNLSTSKAIVIDGITPSAVNLAGGGGTVVATGGTVIAGYWNSTNTALAVVVPIAADASLNGGSVQLQGYWGVVGGAQNLGSAQTIDATGTNKTITISSGVLEAFGGFAENEVLKIVALVTDIANNTSSLGTDSDDEITIDQTAANIIDITTTAADGYLIPTNTADITVTFDEVVTLSGGNLEIELETGTTDRDLIISTISSSTTGTGTYTVQAGDASSDLTANSASLSAGTLLDAAGNSANLLLPGSSNLGDNSNLIIDGNVPTITSITSTTPDGDYSIGEDVNITVNFSEAVTLSGGDLQIQLETGAVDRTVSISSISNSSSASGTYTVQSNDESSDLSVNGPLTLSAGSLQDIAGNDVDFALGTNLNVPHAIVIDGVAPSTVNLAGGLGTIIATGGTVEAGYWNNTNTALSIVIPIAADASLLNGTVQVKGYWGVVGGALDLGSPQTILATGTNKIIPISDVTFEALGGGITEGEILKIVAIVTDEAGNSSTVGTESDDEITIDQTSPAVSSISSTTANGYLIPTNTANVTVTFDEAVTLAGGNLEVELETGATDQTVSIGTINSSLTASGTYTVQTDDVSSDLNANSLDLSAGTLLDAAGNSADLTIPGGSNLSDNKDLVVDGIAPTILSITSTTPDGDYAIGEDINVTVTFSEAVTLSGGNLQIELETGSPDRVVSISTIANSSTALGTYTVQSGDVTSALAANTPLTLSSGTLKDVAGNNVDLAVTTNIDAASDIDIDGIIPTTVDLAGGAGSVVATGGTVKAGYWNNINTALSVVVPIAADASLLNGNVQLRGYWGTDAGAAVDLGSAQIIAATGTNKTISLPALTVDTFGGFDEGEILKIIAVVTDAAGNSSVAGTESDDEITIDQTAPEITSLSSTTANGYLIPTSTANVTITFDETVTLNNGNILIELETGTTDQSVTISTVNASLTASGTYTVQTDDNSNDLNANGITLSAGTLLDAAGNSANLSIPGGNNLADNAALIVDGSAPEIVSVTSSSADNNYGVDSNIDVTVEFSELVTLSGGELLIQMETGTVDRTVTISSISSSIYGYGTYTVQAGDESSDLSVNGPLTLSGGNIQDGAGNDADLAVPVNISDGSDIIIDGVAPGAFTVGTVVTVGDPVVTGYWNNLNTGMTVIVPIANEATLESGSVQIQGYYGDISGAANIGSATNIVAGMLGTTTTEFTITEANIIAGVGVVEGQTLKITALITDNSGNGTTGTQSVDDFYMDVTDPDISAITSIPTAGTYKLGETIDVTVTFTENVVLLSGDMETTLETGVVLTSVEADLDGSGAAVTETYTIEEGDESSDLSVTSIGLTAGTLRDLAGNDFPVGVPPLGTNLSDNSNLVIDGAPPTITLISTGLADASYGVDDVIDITITFEDPVTLSDGNTLQMTLNTGQVVSIASADIISTTSATGYYTIQVGDVTATELDVSSLALDGGTLQDVAGNDLSLAIGAPSFFSEAHDIVIDGIYPQAFDTGDLTVVGDPVVSGYWNTLNDSIYVEIPVTGADLSLDGGTAHIETRLDANDFTTIGNSVPVGTNDVLVGVSRDELQTQLPGYFGGELLEVRGVLTDVAGNATIGATSLTTLTNDQVNPTQTVTGDIVVAGGNEVQGYWNLTNETLTISTPLDDDASMIGGVFQMKGRKDLEAGSDVGSDSILTTVNTTMETILTVADLTNGGFLAGVSGTSLSFWAELTDVAGNVIDGVTGVNTVIVDLDAPSAFNVGAVIATASDADGVVVEDAFNISNDGISVTITIEDDATLVDGQLITQIKAGAEDYVAVDTSTIPIEDVDQEVLIDRPTLETLVGWADGVDLLTKVIMIDRAGNETEGTPSTNELRIDLTAPSAFAVTSFTTVGGTVVPGFWNSTNTGVEFVVPIEADQTLLSGQIQAYAVDYLDDTLAIGLPVDVNSLDPTPLTLDELEIESVTEMGDGLAVPYFLELSDRHGNSTRSTFIDTLFVLDTLGPGVGAILTSTIDNGPYFNAVDSVFATWSDFTDPHSGVDTIEYSVGTLVGQDNVVAWTGTDTNVFSVQFSELSTILHDVDYFINVRAIDDAGNISDTLSTPIVTADLENPWSAAFIDPFYFDFEWNDVNSFNGEALDDLSGPDSLYLTLQRASDSFWWDNTSWSATSDTFKYKITDGTWNFGIVKDSLDNREDYTIFIETLDSAGNWQAQADEYTFQFVINTAPEFAVISDTLYVDEDDLWDYEIIATDVDLGTISGDTLSYSIFSVVSEGASVSASDSMEVDPLTAIFDWTPMETREFNDVGVHNITAKVADYYGGEDDTTFVLVVRPVNDPPDSVSLLLPVDSTQLVPADGLLLTFEWNSAFDIEGDSLTYRIYLEGTDYDTSIAVNDTTITLDVAALSLPLNPVNWYVRALDSTEISAVGETFQFTTSAPQLVLLADTVSNAMVRYTAKDTVFSVKNLGLANLNWSVGRTPNWITLAEPSGSVAYLDTSDIVFNIDLGQITVGGYADSIEIFTNDPLHDTVTVYVTLDIYDLPTPVVAFYKNPAYPSAYELMIVDSLGMVDILTVSFEGEELTIVEVDTFSYLVSVDLETVGDKSFEINASNWTGDTTITAEVTVSLAKGGASWLARSPDKQFEIHGSSNSSVNNSHVVILDSLLSEKADARYKVLTDGMSLAEPVLVSLPAEEIDRAIYIQNTEGKYEELATMKDGERVFAWADRLGAFKTGPKSIIVPEQSRLTQNYPNPFNPTTTIDYDIGFLDGLYQDVEFNIYNIRGQIVKTLVDQQVQPGQYSVVWNGLDEMGKQVSSGIYFARLMTGKGYANTVKMLVLR
jgi:hypothetical protein